MPPRGDPVPVLKEGVWVAFPQGARSPVLKDVFWEPLSGGPAGLRCYRKMLVMPSGDHSFTLPSS